MEVKYINHSEIGFVLWARTDLVYHSDMAHAVCSKAVGKIVTAGFAHIVDGFVECYGMSESLNIESHKGDSVLLADQLGLKPV